jgi:hypothetical protein
VSTSSSQSDDLSTGPVDMPCTLEAMGCGASADPVASGPPTEPSSSTTTATPVPADLIAPQPLDSAAILACLASMQEQVRHPTLPLSHHMVVVWAWVSLFSWRYI